MSENVIQTSFAAGELAPSIFARTDLQAYHAGLALCRNFFVDYRSGISTRCGTQFVIQALKSATAVRIIPFQFSVTSTYILEFGDKYIRFVSNGASVLEAPFNVTGITNANPAVVTVPGNNFNNGDWVFITGVNGMTQINGRFYQIAVLGSLVTLSDVNGNVINSLALPAYINGGTASRVYTIPSPYLAADLALLKYAQSASVMTLTHPNYVPMNLTLTAPTNWTLTPVPFGTMTVPPSTVSGSASTSGSANYSYVVTSVDGNGQESQASNAATVANAVNIGATAGTITISWSTVTGADHFNVYKAELSISSPVPVGAAYGFVGTANSNAVSFVDSNITPDFSTTPPIKQLPFAAGNNPGTFAYFQQRATYGGSNANPLTFYMSQPGIFNDFDKSNPVQDDDAITATIVSSQVNAIKNFVPMPGGLIALTAKGAWLINGGSSAVPTSVAVTPANIQATPQAYNGASDVPPIVVNEDVIYVQAKGSIVRDLEYNIYANIYTGSDISILSNHLFFGFTITQWAWVEEPYKIIWAIRSDGKLLSLTYVKDQKIKGWAQHDTLGLFQSVASISEGQNDVIYVVVKRFIGGRFVQMIERMANRLFIYGAEDAWAVDCGTQSALPTPNANLTATSSTGACTFTADQPVFSAGTVGQVLRMGGGIATITAFITPTQVVGTLTQPISQTLPEDPTNTPVPATPGNWSIARQFTVFSNLDYLNGQVVSILADGSVLPQQVVTNGTVTLSVPASKVTVGLAFVAQAQTMYLDVGEPTIQGKRKKINALSVRAKESRGLYVGRGFNTLVPVKEMNPAVFLGTPVPLVTGDERVIMDPLWDVPGQLCMQVSDPVPCTILGVIPEISVGDTK
jgi:hypothetical protein